MNYSINEFEKVIYNSDWGIFARLFLLGCNQPDLSYLTTTLKPSGAVLSGNSFTVVSYNVFLIEY